MLGFCEQCHNMVECSVKRERKSKEIKGTRIEYEGKEAYCDICGENIFVSEIRDYNLEKLDIAFRESQGIILVSDINKILEKYNIGKRPLSLLLGWGEVTLTRYLDGDIPSKHYSDTLKKVLDDPNYMKEVLEKNKERVSEIAYNSCKVAIDKLTIEKIESKSNIESIVIYLLKNLVDITPLALQKLLYYAQSFSKIFYNEYLFDDDCDAWVHGPVYREIY